MPPPAAPHRPPPPHGPAVTLAAATVVVRAGGRGRRVLDGVTADLPAGAFVGLVGASGSGKSTLVKVLAGLVRLTGGEVRIDGWAVGADRLRTDARTAYLPQDVIVHDALTPAAALGYAAELRGLAPTAAGRAALAAASLERVGLADRADTRIGRLSGGQRKRVGLAAALLGHPRLVLLDEPTSGLDPAAEAAMMGLFRSLADGGLTVVCVTHAPAHLRLCDRLVWLAGGACVFAGPPAEAPGFFGTKSLAAAYPAVGGRPAADWQAAFVAAHPARAAAPPAAAGAPPDDPPPPPPRAVSQAAVLTRRYARLYLADARAVALQAAQAPVIGLMIGATFGDIRAAFAEQEAADARQVLFVTAVAVLWCAGTAGVREVVKELAVVRHESRTGLDLRAYVASKGIVLGAAAVGQAVLLVAVVRATTHLPGPWPEQYLAAAGVGLAGAAVGLAVSAAAGTAERAVTVLPVAVIGQAVFSGGLARLAGWAEWAGRLLSPAYWGLDGFRAPLSATLTNATYPGAPGEFQPPILGGGGPLWADLVALAAQTAALLAIAWAAVRRAVRRAVRG